jgi:TusA-related sulfurtransferase
MAKINMQQILMKMATGELLSVVFAISPYVRMTPAYTKEKMIAINTKTYHSSNLVLIGS